MSKVTAGVYQKFLCIRTERTCSIDLTVVDRLVRNKEISELQ